MGGRSTRRPAGNPFVPATAVYPEAASGLRPAGVFVLIGMVFAAVVVRGIYIQAFAEGRQPDARRETAAPAPSFSILDRDGVPLALSVETFDVTISPRAMWRSHTPERMARRISEALAMGGPPSGTPERGAAVAGPEGPGPEDPGLAGPSVGAILERSMPPSFSQGWVAPEDPRLLRFSAEGADVIRRYLSTGGIGERVGLAPVRGLELVALEGSLGGGLSNGVEAAVWTLAMEPIVLLGADVRREQFGVTRTADGRELTASPERWTRRLLDDLVSLVGEERILEAIDLDRRAAVEKMSSIERRELLREEVWAELIPTRFRVLVRGVDPVRGHRLQTVLREEGVSPWQVQLVSRVERRHPTRPGGRPAAPDAELAMRQPGDAFGLLGHWGVLDEGRADYWARKDRAERPHLLPWEEAADPFVAYRESLVVERMPWSGVERVARTEIENGPWSDLVDEVRGRTYTYRSRVLARDRRRAWEGGVPEYFLGATEATEVPAVVSTLDAHLQEVVHAELGALMEEHSPAMAMAIVVDVQTGDVLALDSRCEYAYSGFAPLLHVFTPGSTFKAIIMALALDAGATRPDRTYATFAREGGLRLPGRRIREAEGAPEADRITASEGLAFSCNAVLVQIAHEMEAAHIRERLVALGYDAAPGAGLGPERAGRLTPLRKGTWSRNQTHASVAFGHEVGVTLWQHAAALATMLRGGERRPLRLLRGIERGGEAWDLDVPAGERVLSQQACEDVREMMALGAEIGTGRHIANAEANPEFEWIGTKTGTTQKVGTELCAHLEMKALAEFALAGRRWTSADRRALFQQSKDHKTCYTSSICAAGRVMTEDGPREVMVLVVADEPRGREKFGSRVTGGTALAILRQAFGLPRTLALVAEGTGPRREAARGPKLFRRDDQRAASFGAPFDASWLGEDLPWAAIPSDESDGEPAVKPLEGRR